MFVAFFNDTNDNLYYNHTKKQSFIIEKVV